uniref:Secreted protein n=1 Tax=Angiostrongylus cantonensis TaxID=6313 RepID=A0A0K0D7Q6_ANGCA
MIRKKNLLQVILTGLTTLNTPPSEERCISNYGWVPMEGGNFDRPRENRNSLAGPLSIIRLSSSPLDRTPSPTLPEQENGGNKRRSYFSPALLFCHTRLVRWAYKEATYPGWNAAIYRNHGLLQRSEENVEINPTPLLTLDSFPRIHCPRRASKS